MRPVRIGIGTLLLLLTGCAQKQRGHLVTIPAMERQVLNAVESGEGNGKVRELRARVAAQPDHVGIRLELAEQYRLSGFPELELEHLRLAADRFPKSTEAMTALTRALLRGERALEAARRLIVFLEGQQKPDADLLSWAGIALDQVGDWKQGEAMHRKAIQRAPQRDPLHNNLGYNLLMQGRKAEAIESFRRALDLNPASESARNNLGITLADRPEEALTQFRQAADLGVAHNNLAASLFEKGDIAGARHELELALQYRADVPEIMENLRKVAAVDGKPVTIRQPQSSSLWKRFARGMKHAFIDGEPKKSVAGTVEAAQ